MSEVYENLTGEPRLELKVITLNINEGHNKELMEQCKVLGEYAQYVAKVRKYTKEMLLDAAVKCAVDECIREGILKDYLQENRDGVIAMSIFEYNKEEEEKKLRKAEFAAGYDKGHDLGEQEGILNSLRNLMETMNLAMESAMDALKIPEKDRETYEEYLKKHK